jgi:hypothetical protein
MDCLYVIRHQMSGMVKIGITSDWPRRAAELGVGTITEELIVWSLPAPYHRRAEQDLHRAFDGARLPQSEWFCVPEEEVLAMVRAELPRWEQLVKLGLEGCPWEYVETPAGLLRWQCPDPKLHRQVMAQISADWLAQPAAQGLG